MSFVRRQLLKRLLQAIPSAAICVKVGLLAATGIADADAHESPPLPPLIVGSLASDDIALLSLKEGKLVQLFRQVGFSTVQLRTFAINLEGTLAVAVNEADETFRLILSNGRSIHISPPMEGMPQSGAAHGNFVAVIAKTHASFLFYRFRIENDRGLTALPEHVLVPEGGDWIWRVSPWGIFAISQTNWGRLQTVFWEPAIHRVIVETIANPNLDLPGEWLDLYDAQFSTDGAKVFVSAEWGIDSGGPADRVDMVVVYDPAKAALIKSYPFWSAEPSEQCTDSVYLVVGDSMARVRGDNGEKCGSRPVSKADQVLTDFEGNHYYAGESSLPMHRPLLEMGEVIKIPQIFPQVFESRQATAIGRQGQFVWFSMVIRRSLFRENRIKRIPSVLSGVYNLQTGEYWLYDARNAYIFEGGGSQCESACGLWARVLDRLPANLQTLPFSVVDSEWRLMMDRETGLPCLVLVAGKKAWIYPLIDRRGEFPYSPTQEWDYTGLFRARTYRIPTMMDHTAASDCAMPANETPPANYGNGLAGSLQWFGGSEDDRAWLIAILEKVEAPNRRIVGFKASETHRVLESATSDPIRGKAFRPDIAFSLEGEEFAMELLPDGNFVLRRTYTAYPRTCLSRAPVRWTDTYELSVAGLVYRESHITDGTVLDDPCIRREVEATLSLAQPGENKKERGGTELSKRH